jgi:hypothetical protein
MTMVRILRDTADERFGEKPVAPGTIVLAEIEEEFGEAWYDHPDSGQPWFSFEEDYELVED